MTTQLTTQYPAAHYGLPLAQTPKSKERVRPLPATQGHGDAAFLRMDPMSGNREVDVAQHESHLYASGMLPRPEGFQFSREMIRIDWRTLAGVDINSLVRMKLVPVLCHCTWDTYGKLLPSNSSPIGQALLLGDANRY